MSKKIFSKKVQIFLKKIPLQRLKEKHFYRDRQCKATATTGRTDERREAT